MFLRPGPCHGRRRRWVPGLCLTRGKGKATVAATNSAATHVDEACAKPAQIGKSGGEHQLLSVHPNVSKNRRRRRRRRKGSITGIPAKCKTVTPRQFCMHRDFTGAFCDIRFFCPIDHVETVFFPLHSLINSVQEYSDDQIHSGRSIWAQISNTVTRFPTKINQAQCRSVMLPCGQEPTVPFFWGGGQSICNPPLNEQVAPHMTSGAGRQLLRGLGPRGNVLVPDSIWCSLGLPQTIPLCHNAHVLDGPCISRRIYNI